MASLYNQQITNAMNNVFNVFVPLLYCQSPSASSSYVTITSTRANRPLAHHRSISLEDSGRLGPAERRRYLGWTTNNGLTMRDQSTHPPMMKQITMNVLDVPLVNVGPSPFFFDKVQLTLEAMRLRAAPISPSELLPELRRFR